MQSNVEMEEVGPELQLELASTATSTPKSNFATNIEQMHSLIIGNNKTVLEASSISETSLQKSKLDGSWDVSRYRNPKAAGKARRQMERRKRARERAELSASGSAQPDPKKSKEGSSSGENTDVEPEKTQAKKP